MIEQLKARRDEIRAKINGDMSALVVKAAQARIDVITHTINKLEALDRAKAEADQAVSDCQEWGI